MSATEAWQVSTEAAEIYERDFVPVLFAPWAPRLVDAAAVQPGTGVLDVGCGTGIVAREAAARVGATGRVVGVDLNAGMLQVARRIAPRIEWRQGDATHLPFDDGTFDAVLCQFVLMFVPDRVAALQEMWRVLSPGGRLAVATWGPLQRVPAFATLVDILERRLGSAAAAVLQTPFQLDDPLELMALCRTAGVTDPRVVTEKGRARYPSLDDFVRIKIKGTPLAERVNDTDFAAVLAEARARMAFMASPSGPFEFEMEANILTSRKAGAP